MKNYFFAIFSLFLTFYLSSCKTDQGLDIVNPATLGFKDSTYSHPKDLKYRLLLSRYVREKQLPALGLLIHDKHGLWLDARGNARIEDRTPLKTNHLFMPSDITSTLTAVLVLQMIEQGKMKISDPITLYLDGKYLKNIKNSESITINHLLSHTSGIPNFLEIKNWLLDTANDYEREYNPEKILDYLRHAKPSFAPSEGFQYSATNYLLLSLILDQNVEKGHAALVENQIFKKAGMSRSYYKSGENYPNVKGVVNFYWDKRNNKVLENITQVNLKQMSYLQGHDGALTTLYDLFLFSNALQKNTLFQSPLPAKIMQDWIGTSDSTAYGAGLERRQTVQGQAFGHRGKGFGATTYWYYFPDSKTTIIFTTNIGTRTSEWTNEALEEFWQDLLKVVF